MNRYAKKVLLGIVAVIVLWGLAFVFDYGIAIGNNRDPIFCSKGQIYEYDDGTVKEFKCIGYKIYVSDRKSCSKNQIRPASSEWEKIELDECK